MLHDLQDLQALGSLTIIWRPFSDTWDNRHPKNNTNKTVYKKNSFNPNNPAAGE